MPVETISLKQIAGTLNLSTGTVSRALRGHGGIAQHTRDMVAKTAAGLKYAPRRSLQAKADALRRIGVCIGNPCVSADGLLDSSFVGLHYLIEIEKAVLKVEASVQVGFVDAMAADACLDRLPIFQDGGMQGFVLVYPFPESFVRQLANRGPIISIEHAYPSVSLDTVGPAHSRDAMSAVDYLHRLGHKRIAYVCDEEARGNKLTVGLRHAGYTSGMIYAGLDYRQEDVANIDPPYIEKSELTDWVLGRIEDGVTAVITSIDRHGYLLWNSLPSRGVRVPEDVSIVGIGGVHRSKGLPQLTTWRCDYEAIARTAINTLQGRRSGKHTSDLYQEVASVFVQGDTSAAPR